jgi:hypothetical protein
MPHQEARGHAASKGFFLKKEAKTSIRSASLSPWRRHSQADKSFLVLFCKKELLACPTAIAATAWVNTWAGW